MFDLGDVEGIDSARLGALPQVLKSVAGGNGVVKIAASKDRSEVPGSLSGV